MSSGSVCIVSLSSGARTLMVQDEMALLDVLMPKRQVGRRVRRVALLVASRCLATRVGAAAVSLPTCLAPSGSVVSAGNEDTLGESARLPRYSRSLFVLDVANKQLTDHIGDGLLHCDRPARRSWATRGALEHQSLIPGTLNQVTAAHGVTSLDAIASETTRRCCVCSRAGGGWMPPLQALAVLQPSNLDDRSKHIQSLHHGGRG